MSFFDGEACPDDNLKGILSIHLKLGIYIHSIKIWKSLDFGIDWLRNGRVIVSTPLGGGHIIFAFSAVCRPPSHLVSRHFRQQFLSYLYQIWHAGLLG